MSQKKSNLFYWDKIYKKTKHISSWPWTDLVSLINNFSRQTLNNKQANVLELGFGAGANIPLFINCECNYYGIEHSPHIVNKVKKIFKKVERINLETGDFTKKLIDNIKFDLIFDRGAITCNNFDETAKTINLIKKNLHQHGIFMGIDWFSKNSSECQNKKKRYLNFSSGKLKNIGSIYFFTKEEIMNFFSDYKFLYFHEKKVKNFKTNKSISTFTFVIKNIKK